MDKYENAFIFLKKKKRSKYVHYEYSKINICISIDEKSFAKMNKRIEYSIDIKYDNVDRVMFIKILSS